MVRKFLGCFRVFFYSTVRKARQEKRLKEKNIVVEKLEKKTEKNK